MKCAWEDTGMDLSSVRPAMGREGARGKNEGSREKCMGYIGWRWRGSIKGKVMGLGAIAR